MEQEKWKDIEGFEGLYQVSSLGRVANVRNGNRKILKTDINQRGYQMVKLCKGGKKKGIRVHRLVAVAFVPNPKDLPQVDHINNDKTMNIPSNLRWVDNRENSRKRNHTNRRKPCAIVDSNGNVIKRFPSESSAAKEIGVNRTTVMAACNGHQKTCAGFKIIHLEM